MNTIQTQDLYYYYMDRLEVVILVGECLLALAADDVVAYVWDLRPRQTTESCVEVLPGAMVETLKCSGTVSSRGLWPRP